MKNNRKGFTLMEMLIVVAIIAILIAVAIPTFSNALTKAKLATDKANVRSAYALAQTAVMLDESTTQKYILGTDGKLLTFTTGDNTSDEAEPDNVYILKASTSTATGDPDTKDLPFYNIAGCDKNWTQGKVVQVDITGASATEDAKFTIKFIAAPTA